MIKQGGRIAGTHHQARRHLWISGTPGTVYQVLIEERKTLRTPYFTILLIRNAVTVGRSSGSQYRLAKASHNVPEVNKSYSRTIK
jgi:hypothetical protein